MTRHLTLVPMVVLSMWVCACTEKPVTPSQPELTVTEKMVEIVNQKLEPLSQNPALWTDDQLRFLGPLSNNNIVGLGEATHGTSEFFKAKQRIFRYLVENHGFKIFAIEADFGESIFVNEAVLKSDKSQIETLMKEKMHFWTWRTNEVRDLLYWMCDYNLGKPEAEKIQYWGVDCQYNTYHPDMVEDFLKKANVPFMAFAKGVLDEARSTAAYETYTAIEFDNYLKRIAALKDMVMNYKADIIAAGSMKQYQLLLQLVEEIREVSQVKSYTTSGASSSNYRDEYMAKNTRWLQEYFPREKMVLWAHNLHISNGYYLSTWRPMGSHLNADIRNDYGTVGFLFSKGSFVAVGAEGLNIQAIQADPKSGSINEFLSMGDAPVFTIKVSDIQGYSYWKTTFSKGIEQFTIGAGYNNNPSYYYYPFKPEYFDQLIYFNTTNAAVPLK